LKVIWVSLKVRIVHSNPDKKNLLNACVLLRRENIIVILDPLLGLALLRDWHMLSKGEIVDDS
jgi:hypothetical protein